MNLNKWKVTTTVLLFLSVIGLCTADSGTLAVPNTFANGDIADASQINANFTYLTNAINNAAATASPALQQVSPSAPLAVPALPIEPGTDAPVGSQITLNHQVFVMQSITLTDPIGSLPVVITVPVCQVPSQEADFCMPQYYIGTTANDYPQGYSYGVPVTYATSTLGSLPVTLQEGASTTLGLHADGSNYLRAMSTAHAAIRLPSGSSLYVSVFNLPCANCQSVSSYYTSLAQQRAMLMQVLSYVTVNGNSATTPPAPTAGS